MKRKTEWQASITVYFALILVCIAALILTLVETARFQGLNADAAEWTNLTVESLFAGYQPAILEKYDMFALDGNFGEAELSVEAGEAEMEAVLQENVQLFDEKDGMNLYRLRVNQVEIVKYMLITDQDGAVFEAQAAEVMKSKLGEIAAQKILNQILQIEEGEKTGEDPEQKIMDAEDALKALQNQQEESHESSGALQKGAMVSGRKAALPESEKEYGSKEEYGNPLEEIKSMKEGILALVVPKGTAISGKTMDISDCLTKRTCKKGTDNREVKNSWYERILMQEYLKEYGGNFCKPNSDAALSYGVEYLICGKGSDSENLESVVKKLLLIREVANYVYLQSDAAKQAEALTAASAVAAASLNPAVVEVVKQGILAAWAYAESICDVRILLAGGKVSLIKTSAGWNTQLSNLANAVSGEVTGTETGLDYVQYLDALLYSKTKKQLSYRFMDLMEQWIRQETAFAENRMDHMMVRMQIQAQYDADTIFLGFFQQEKESICYSFVKKAEYSYE